MYQFYLEVKLNMWSVQASSQQRETNAHRDSLSLNTFSATNTHTHAHTCAHKPQQLAASSTAVAAVVDVFLWQRSRGRDLVPSGDIRSSPLGPHRTFSSPAAPSELEEKQSRVNICFTKQSVNVDVLSLAVRRSVRGRAHFSCRPSRRRSCASAPRVCR